MQKQALLLRGCRNRHYYSGDAETGINTQGMQKQALILRATYEYAEIQGNTQNIGE